MSDNAFADLIILLNENDPALFRQHLLQMKGSQRQQLLQQMRWHRVFMQFYIKCKAHTDVLPKTFNQTLEKSNQYLLRRGLKAIAHLQRVNQAFNQNGIEYMLFKGMAISEQIHGTPIMRNPKDMDLLFKPQDIKKAHDILISLGYKQHTPSITPHDQRFNQYMRRQKDAVYLDESDDIAIEIHWRLDINAYTLPMTFNDWYSRRRLITIGDTQISTFGLNDTLCHLAAHGCISMWGRLCWILDWQQLTQRLDANQYQQFIKIAQKRDLTRMVNIANLICAKLFNDTLKSQYAYNKIEHKTAQLVLTNLAQMRYPPEYQRYLRRIALKPGFLYKYNYLHGAITMLIAGERNIKED